MENKLIGAHRFGGVNPLLAVLVALGPVRGQRGETARCSGETKGGVGGIPHFKRVHPIIHRLPTGPHLLAPLYGDRPSTWKGPAISLLSVERL